MKQEQSYLDIFKQICRKKTGKEESADGKRPEHDE
jgi:hypothetical protein